MTYDAWKTRSDLDEEDRLRGRPERCEFCDAPLGEHPWAFWCSDGGMALFCDDCAEKRDGGGDDGRGEDCGDPRRP
jgi:hypothetical protein